jgi:hypothetical protein
MPRIQMPQTLTRPDKRDTRLSGLVAADGWSTSPALVSVRARQARRRALDPLSPPRLDQRRREQLAAGPARLLIDLARAVSRAAAMAEGHHVRRLVRTCSTVISRLWWVSAVSAQAAVRALGHR